MTKICIRCGRELEEFVKGTNFCELCYQIVVDVMLETARVNGEFEGEESERNG